MDERTTERNQGGAELSILRKRKRDLEDRVDELENVRSQDDARYRELLKDYDSLAEKKTVAQMKSTQLEESLRDKEKIVLNLHSVNAELEKDLARARAPKSVFTCRGTRVGSPDPCVDFVLLPPAVRCGARRHAGPRWPTGARAPPT